MPRAFFHVSVTDSSAQNILYQEKFYQIDLNVGPSAKSDVRFKDLPNLAFELLEDGSVILSNGKKSTKLSENKRISFEQGWQLSIELNKEECAARLQFTRLASAADEGDKPGSNKRFVLPFMIALLTMGIVSSPWWLVNTSPEKEQHFVEKMLEGTLSPGPLHAAHAQATQQCSDCHQETFESIPIEPCLSCHVMKRHLTQEQTGVHPLCVTCHKEHETPSVLVHRDSRLCTQCHANHSALDSVLADGIKVELDVVNDFPGSHPEFSVAPQITPGITFSHAFHLNEGNVAEQGDHGALSCANCHQPDERERGFQAVTMKSACSSCHKLSYETESGVIKPIVHGDLLWAAELSRPLLNSSLEAQCGNCHTLPNESIESLDQLQIWANNLTTKVQSFDHIRFSHGRHQTNFECVDCHTNAETSEEASDSLMPAKQACAGCHVSHPETNGVLKTECADCHTFHTVPWD